MSIVLCASMIRKKEEWIKEKSCVVASLAKQREFLSCVADEEKLWIMLQMNENLIVYIFLFDKNISFFLFLFLFKVNKN